MGRKTEGGGGGEMGRNTGGRKRERDGGKEEGEGKRQGRREKGKGKEQERDAHAIIILMIVRVQCTTHALFSEML